MDFIIEYRIVCNGNTSATKRIKVKKAMSEFHAKAALGKRIESSGCKLQIISCTEDYMGMFDSIFNAFKK